MLEHGAKDLLAASSVLGDIRKLWGNPRTQGFKNAEQAKIQIRNAIHERGDKESPKDCLRFKSCVLLHVPSRPFYRETKGLFTSRKYPRIQRIFLVWTCTQNVFYISWFGGLISHIYKPVNSSHVEPRLRVNSMSIETKGYKEYLDSKSLQEYLNSNLKLRTQKTGKYLERLTSIFFVFTSFNSSQVS
jgi:hypothetical protein